MATVTEGEGLSLTLTIPQVGKLLGISRGLAYDLARRDALPVPVIRLGEKRMCVSRKAVQRLLEGQDRSDSEQSHA
jgi:predicted DNA-binding transcriptional regulator AlpA